MCSQITLDKIRCALMRPLLPIDRLREIVDLDPPGVAFHELSKIESDDEFIIMAYEQLLGRPPGPHCLANWMSRLTDGNLSRAEVVDRLRSSDEGKARRAKVHGLDYALAISSKRFYKRWKGWLAWKKRTIGQYLQPRFREPLATGSLSDRVLALERQVSGTAASCLHVFEHIESRLSKVPSNSKPVHAAITPQLANEHVSDKQAQLYRQISELLSEAEPTPLGSAIAGISRLLSNDLRSHPWMFTGLEAHEVIQACKQQRIKIGAIATPTPCLSFAKQQGIEAVDVPLGQFLRAAAPAAASVIWLRSQLSDCTDGDLLGNLEDMQRILIPGGCIVFEEDAKHSFHGLRIRAAIQVCGFKLLFPNSLPSWRQSEQRSYLVAQQTATEEVMNVA